MSEESGELMMQLHAVKEALRVAETTANALRLKAVDIESKLIKCGVRVI